MKYNASKYMIRVDLYIGQLEKNSTHEIPYLQDILLKQTSTYEI